MIEKLIEQERYEEALEKIGSQYDDVSIYQKIVCLYGLEKYEEAYIVSKSALEKVEKNYYDVLCMHIAVLVALEKDEEAIELLEEELRMPYIPYQYENFLNTTYDTLYRKKLQNSKKYNMYDVCNDQELKDILIEQRDKHILLIVLDQLSKRNIRLYLNELRFILKAKDYPNEVKTVILELLGEQGVDEQVIVYNNGVEMEVDICSLTPLMEQLSIDEILNRIEESVDDKDISIFNACQDLLIAYLASVYPIEIEEDEYDVIAASLYYAAVINYNIDKSLEEICDMFDVKQDFIEPYYEKISKLSTF